MKILLSAYACEPDKGSEPGVGWNWALALKRLGHDVHVITRGNNQDAIERIHASSQSRLKFNYYDLPAWARFWKHWPGGIYLYYGLWQLGAYRYAKRLHARQHFDLVHHITFVSFRQPSFMGGLGIPFIFGPVGGGESMPGQFRRALPLRCRLAERIRNLGNLLVAIDPMMRHTYSRASVIACTTDETMQALPARFRNKCIVQRAIGIEESRIEGAAGVRAQEERAQFLFVGRLLYWKGLHLALRALARVKQDVLNVRLRIIGEGTEADWFKSIAEDAKVSDLVEWIPSRPQQEIWEEYRRSIGFIFPSLHDSGGMVVLEALSAGLPVICLNLGGPGAIVDSSCGFRVEATETTESEVISGLASAMIQLARDARLRQRLADGALQTAREVTWDAAAKSLFSNAGIAGKSVSARADKSLLINEM